jgi:hypothetical protein
MEPQGAHKDHEEQEQGDERWHTVHPFYSPGLR